MGSATLHLRLSTASLRTSLPGFAPTVGFITNVRAESARLRPLTRVNPAEQPLMRINLHAVGRGLSAV